uniref:Uncharacterized protein n=1 Tax=Plectus sambesii TaxID=2011161 RepID=A0A914VQ01_9BILA
TANAIIEQCKHASEKVAKRLAARKHKSHLAFLSQKKDGSTCLNIVTPEGGGGEMGAEEPHRSVRLGDLLKKLKEGT